MSTAIANAESESVVKFKCRALEAIRRSIDAGSIPASIVFDRDAHGLIATITAPPIHAENLRRWRDHFGRSFGAMRITLAESSDREG